MANILPMASASASSSTSPPPRMLTLARDLRRRKARERTDVFVAEGIRTVEALLASTVSIQGVLVSPQLSETPRGKGLLGALEHRVEVTHVSLKDFASACDTESPQGILAIAKVPLHGWAQIPPSPSPRRIILLDGVQDPGNVGTIVRTAAALGSAATVAMPGTVDLWNAKVVRSAMGALFSHVAFASDWDTFDRHRAQHPAVVWGADVAGEPMARMGVVPPDLAIIVGNEGAGLSASARARVDQLVSLPIAGVESLNVAVAAGIFLYETRAGGADAPPLTTGGTNAAPTG